ncbi:MAG: HEPN domain-containing protein [Pseudomonas profundi]|uniref:HEPN domain-containing protein n=1 Tax=Pseudomonas profundi TaxID=1981513 RepID=UPI0030016890
MTSVAFETFQHVIQDAVDLFNLFDALNTNPPPAEAEVLKRASLVMALAALETYVEDRVVEAANAVTGVGSDQGALVKFYKSCLENDLKYFHTPSTDRVKTIFMKYLDVDVTQGWVWNHYDPTRAKAELNKITKKRGDIAHRSGRPLAGQPSPHAVTREDLRKHIRFIKDLVTATDEFLESHLGSGD